MLACFSCIKSAIKENSCSGLGISWAIEPAKANLLASFSVSIDYTSSIPNSLQPVLGMVLIKYIYTNYFVYHIKTNITIKWSFAHKCKCTLNIKSAFLYIYKKALNKNLTPHVVI